MFWVGIIYDLWRYVEIIVKILTLCTNIYYKNGFFV